MEVDIGGRHIPMGDIILMRRHTAERIGEQPTTIPPRELMAGRKPPTARTDRRRGEPRITRTPEPMLRPDKAPARRLNGAAPMCRVETKALPWAITPPLMER